MNRSLWYVGLLVIAAGITLAAVPPGGTDGLIGTTTDGGGASVDDLPVSLVSTGNVVTGSDRTTAAPANGTSVAALVNDIDAPVNVTYAAAIDDEAVESTTATDRVTIPRGGQHLVYARCTAGPAAAGTATLRLAIQQTTVEDPIARDVVVNIEVQYDCPEEDGSAEPTTADETAADETATTADETTADETATDETATTADETTAAETMAA